jgi:hypothetical protein
VHDTEVPGEEAGGAVVPGSVDGDHNVRGAAHAPQPRQSPGKRRAPFHAAWPSRAAAATPHAAGSIPSGPDEHDAHAVPKS